MGRGGSLATFLGKVKAPYSGQQRYAGDEEAEPY
jgi:hypothetical protein